MLWRRLAVFRGSFSLAAAVCMGEGDTRLDATDTDFLELLAQLVSKSLVVVVPGDGERRYRLLEPMRQYAAEQLDEAGETTLLHTRHRDWYLAWSESHQPGLFGSQQSITLQKFELEYSNLRTALAWDQDALVGLQLAAAVARLWFLTNRFVEGYRWIVTLGGWLGDHPPTDDQGFLEYARSLPAPDLHQVISRAEPLSDIVTYKLPSNLRRHYERMKRFPEGYLVLGDAMCSFNPIYGQGMSVASMQAEVLENCLKDAGRRGSLRGLSRMFFKRAAVALKNPWTLAVGEDFRFPGVQGSKPPGTDQINRYVLSVNRTAHHNKEVARRFYQVMHMIHPPTALFHPRVVLRVIWNRVLRRGKQPHEMQRPAPKVVEV